MINAKAREAFDSLANSRGRTLRHVLTGLALTASAVVVSAAIARRNAPTEDNPEVYSDYQELEQPKIRPPRQVFSVVWPPLFLALTLSGLRIWNAPKSPARTQALTLWSFVQGLNALWMALGPRRLGGQLATATAALGTAGAYVWRAKRVDAPAAGMVAPYVGWIGFANALTEELWRKNPENRTVH
jgi:tryptophan-rich sensory protein